MNVLWVILLIIGGAPLLYLAIDHVKNDYMDANIGLGLAFMIAMFGLGNPSASYITITSFIPFFTPMIMFLRVGMLEVPFWEIAISIAVLILTIVLLGIIGAKIYRGGVLMYGSSKSLKSIKNALQLSKKN